MAVEIDRVASFPARLQEACESDEPARIARKIGIPYQTVKNYLAGRLPKPDVLVKISDATNVSIHWLLTGEGEKRLRGKGDGFDLMRRIQEIEKKLSPADREFAEQLLSVLKHVDEKDR
jgi:transcriptional regulator with XRE-family HTH domain